MKKISFVLLALLPLLFSCEKEEIYIQEETDPTTRSEYLSQLMGRTVVYKGETAYYAIINAPLAYRASWFCSGGTIVSHSWAGASVKFDSPGIAVVSAHIVDPNTYTDESPYITVTVIDNPHLDFLNTVSIRGPQDVSKNTQISYSLYYSSSDYTLRDITWTINGNVISNFPGFNYTFINDGQYMLSCSGNFAKGADLIPFTREITVNVAPPQKVLKSFSYYVNVTPSHPQLSTSLQIRVTGKVYRSGSEYGVESISTTYISGPTHTAFQFGWCGVDNSSYNGTSLSCNILANYSMHLFGFGTEDGPIPIATTHTDVKAFTHAISF